MDGQTDDPAPEGGDQRPESAELPSEHWSKAREGINDETLEFLRERSRAPGVAEGGAERNHYCMECNGVIPLHYDRRQSSKKRAPETCPHCGAELDSRVRAMFNWVETDEVPDSDLKALLPLLAIGGLIAIGVVWALLF